MTIFADLQALVTEWDQATTAYDEDAGKLAITFCNELGSYLEAPSGKIEPLKVTVDAYGNTCYEVCHSPFSILTKDDRGFFHFAVSVKVPRHDTSPTFLCLTYDIWFFVRDQKCEIEVSRDREKFSVPLSADNRFVPVFEYMIRVMKSVLAYKPWDSEKPKIGFVLGSSN